MNNQLTPNGTSAFRVQALSSWHDDWSGLRVAVLGLDQVGFSVADTLIELGATVLVVSDEVSQDSTSAQANEVEQLLDVIGANKHSASDEKAYVEALVDFAPELVVHSGEYTPGHAALTWAADQQLTVWTDIDLGWRLRDKTHLVADWVLVTGTDRAEVSELTAHMIAAGNNRVIPVGGNESPLLNALRDPQGYTTIVLQLSAQQLYYLGAVSAYASVCLDAAEPSEDLVEWFAVDTTQAHAASNVSAAKVYERTQVACVYHRADSTIIGMVENADVVEGARAISYGLDTPPPSGLGMVEDLLVDRSFHEARHSEAFEIVTLNELQERGVGNPRSVQVILAAAALARSRGIDPAAIAAAVLSTYTKSEPRE